MLMLFHPPTDPDFGWHLKYGEYIFQNHTLLYKNVFSFTNQNYHWANSYWIFELILYVAFTLWGPVGAALLFSFIFSTILYKIIRRQTDNLFVLALLFVFSTIMFSTFYVSIRPFFLSTIFMLIFLDIMIDEVNGEPRPKDQNTKYLPLLFLIWANTHADFVLALFIFGVKIVVNMVQTRKFKFKQDVLVLTGCFLITFINPYGIQLWITLFKELEAPIKNTVAEFSRIDPSKFQLMWLYFGFATVAFVSNLRRKLDWRLVVLLTFFIFSFKSIYFVRIFFMLGIFETAALLHNLVKNTPLKNATSKAIMLMVLLTLLMARVPKFINNLSLASTTAAWATEFSYPYQAISYIRNSKLAGNMFNHYDWGGFLIWQLPEYKTFIDGRMASWRDADNNYFMDDYLKIVKNPANGGYTLFQKYATDNNITFILYKPNTPFAKYLKTSQRAAWKVAFEDSSSVVFVKNISAKPPELL